MILDCTTNLSFDRLKHDDGAIALEPGKHVIRLSTPVDILKLWLKVEEKRHHCGHVDINKVHGTWNQNEITIHAELEFSAVISWYVIGV